MSVSTKRILMQIHTLLSLLCVSKKKNYVELSTKLNELLESIYMLNTKEDTDSE